MLGPSSQDQRCFTFWSDDFNFGLCFEVPIAVVILVVLGWVTPTQLRAQRGYVLVGATVIAAIITPPDLLSQIMLAVPMYILFEIGVFVAGFIRPRDESDLS